MGPLLFLLYINDITNSYTLFKFLLFADDTCLSYNYDESNPETELSLQRELQRISDWLITNRRTINVDKSNYQIFSTGKKQKLTLAMNNEILREKEFTKYLSVVINNKLTWNQHITQTNLRLSKGVGVLYKLRRLCTTNDAEKPLICICTIKHKLLPSCIMQTHSTKK